VFFDIAKVLIQIVLLCGVDQYVEILDVFGVVGAYFAGGLAHRCHAQKMPIAF
jgi:hypothetical protein